MHAARPPRPAPRTRATPALPAALVAVLAAVLLVLAGCATTGAPPAGDAAPTTLTIATSFAVDDLDPIENGFWGNELGYAELLMRPTRDGHPAPWLLTGITEDQPNTWRLALGAGLRFQNGTPLDATALAAAMTYQLAEKAALRTALPGATAVAADPRTVVLTTTRPTPNMANILADESMFNVYDQAAYTRAAGDPQKLVDARIYTGPYAVTRLTPDVMETAADPQYWGGTPALSAVTVKFIPDAQARILAVQNGEADLALYPPATSAKVLAGRSDSFFLTGTPSGPTFQFLLNQHKAPLDDPAVRRAVLTAIDYDELATNVMNGLYEPATGMYLPSLPWAVPTQHTDVAATTAALDGAGWATGPDGVRAKAGTPLRLTVLTYPQQPDSQTLAVAVQAQLKAVGIAVEIQQVPDVEDTMRASSTGWDAAVLGNGTVSFTGDPISPLRNYFASDGSRNFSGIADPELDTLITQLGATGDAATRDALLGRIQQKVADGGLMGFLGMRKPLVVAGPAWKGFTIPPANLWVDATTSPTSS